MKNVYMLDILSVSEEYIVPKLNESILKNRTHYYRDERWYLDDSPEIIELDPDKGGIEVPDILLCNEFVFFSDKLKCILENCGVDYIHYKKITISDEVLGIEEAFYLTCIPRIDCIDFERSSISNADEYDYNDGIVPFYNINKPVIVPENCGRYEIFRLLGSDCSRIYVLDGLYKKLSGADIIGIGFRKVKE